MFDKSTPAPLASRLMALATGPACHNFHAVPWSGALPGLPQDLAAQYHCLLGQGLAGIDSSWIGGVVDSFFAPRGPLAQAQEAAARAFGSDACFFGCMGTTLSNRIAIEAVCPPDGSLLMDRAAHQSLVFAAEARQVTQMPNGGSAEMPCIDPDETIRLLAERRRQGQPFDALVLNACHYDGRRLCLEQILPKLIEASPDTAIVVDEAWSAIHAFDATAGANTTLAVCRGLRRNAPVVVTQSAHKTMAALRQGSYIHLLGQAETITRLAQAVYRHHSTSPSWPILASLDLARAHAEREGADALVRAKERRARLLRQLQETPALRPLLMPLQEAAFYELDPLVVHLRSPAPAAAVQAWLFTRHHVLLGQGHDRLVVRVHIGVRDDDIIALLRALSALVERGPGVASEILPDVAAIPEMPRPPVLRPAAPNTASPNYVIAYPPGVPLVRPGDIWTSAHAERLAREQARGAEIHQLPPANPVVSAG